MCLNITIELADLIRSEFVFSFFNEKRFKLQFHFEFSSLLKYLYISHLCANNNLQKVFAVVRELKSSTIISYWSNDCRNAVSRS